MRGSTLMRVSVHRREILKAMGSAALLTSPVPARSAPAPPTFARMPSEGHGTPKICLGFYGPLEESGMRRLKQIGVDHVLMGGPKIPWDEADIRGRIERFKAGGLTVCNLMISGFND